MSVKRVLAAVAVCLVNGSAVLAQQGDRAVLRAAIIGVVIDQLTGDPVEDVVVEARSRDFFDVASTDANGRFVLSGYFPASVWLQATSERRAAVTHGRGAYGQTSWDDEPQPISVTRGQVLRDVSIPFWRAAVVTGRVTDDEGVPVVGARVQGLDRGAVAGHRVFVDDASVMDGLSTFTDNDGRYRILHGPGPVYLRASSAELRRPAQAGSRAPGVLAFRPTFAPGVASPSAAQPITLTPAQEHVVDLVLHREPSFSVEGIVMGDRGPVSGAYISWAEPGLPEFDDWLTTQSDANGRFSIHGLVRGDYSLIAKTPWDVEARKQKSGRYRLSVSDRSQAISITVRSEPVIRGRYVFAGSSQPPTTVPSDFSLESDAAVWGWSWERWRLLEDPKARPAEFAITVEPGRRVLRLEGAPNGWMLQSITIGQRDITHTPIDVTADLSDVIVTLTDRVTYVRGTVVGGEVPFMRFGARGVWIVPADPSRWVDFGSAPPDIRQLWIDDLGNFEEDSLSPGDYFIAALPMGLSGAPPDATVMRSAMQNAARFSLAQGQHVAVSLSAQSFQPDADTATAWRVDRLPSTAAEVPADPAPARDRRSGSTIRGRVTVEGARRPPAGTVVHLISWTPSIDFTEYVDVEAAGLAGTLAVVDADGRFTFEGVAPGAYVLRAKDSVFALASYPSNHYVLASPTIVRNSTSALQVQVAMKPAARISLVARDEHGRPIPGVNVMLNGTPIPGSWISRVETRTNDRGECFFLGLEPGSYKVHVWAYRGARRVTIAADFEDPLRVPPRLIGEEITRDPGPVALKAGEHRVLNVVIPLGLSNKKIGR